MGDLPFISIIVPVYQVEEYVKGCLNSIASQDYSGRIECIIVDDCGQDNSMALVRQFVETYEGSISFHILRHDYNKGVSAARNTGIHYALGEYILFVDSDDVLLDNTLSTLVIPLRNERFDVVFGKYKCFGLLEAMGPGVPGGIVLREKKVCDYFLRDKLDNTAWNKLYRTDFLLSSDLSFYEGILHEDVLWSVEVALAAKSVCVLDTLTYLYRIRCGSIVTTDSREIREKRLQSYLVIMARTQAAFRSYGLVSDFVTHDYLEHTRNTMFKYARNDRSLFKDYYIRLRKEVPIVWHECFCLNGLHIRKQIRDLHLAIPSPIGFAYYYVWWHLKQTYVEIRLKIQGLFS